MQDALRLSADRQAGILESIKLIKHLIINGGERSAPFNIRKPFALLKDLVSSLTLRNKKTFRFAQN